MTTLTAAWPGPWLQIWLHPRPTVRGLLGKSPVYLELLLVAGSGVIQSMAQATSSHVGGRVPGSTILLMTIAGGRRARSTSSSAESASARPRAAPAGS